MNSTQLGPYTIGRRLGRGGMGAVYEAVDSTTGRTVAVKVLAAHLADDEGLRRRFESEIEALKNLRHPGIVRLIAFGTHDDQPYFAMELVPGKSLEQILRSGRRFTWRETVSLAGEIVRALKAAHDVGIVHRDLKPANLLIADQAQAADGGGQAAGEQVAVKLADFGIARLFGGQSHTAAGHVVGTAEYMAPEQAMGKPLDHRADLYALGLVMYAMLTGAPPFRSAQLTEVIDKQRRVVPPRVSTLVPEVPPELDELIARLLSKDPAQRPANALALGRLLAAIATDRRPAAPTPQAPQRPTSLAPGQAATALDRSDRATREAEDAGRQKPVEQKAARRQQPDPLAPTRDLPSPPQHDGLMAGSIYASAPVNAADGRADAPTQAPARLSTAAASAATVVGLSTRNRFTTVDDLDQIGAERSRKEHLRHTAWQWLTAIGVLVAVAGLGWFLLAPLSADTLYRRITAIAADEAADLRDARRMVEQFLDRHAADPRASEVAALRRRLDIDQLERRSRRPVRSERGLSPLERDYRAAMARQEKGATACLQALQAFLSVHARPGVGVPVDEQTSLWIDLVRGQVERIKPAAEAEQRDDGARIAAIFAEAETLAAQAETAIAETTRRQLAEKRRLLLQGLADNYADRPHAAEALATAKRLLASPETSAADAPTPPPATVPPAANE